jgi:predicted nuclease with TOPRIM domain
MTKDEMKDRISMALKDPILQQGFEIICKENAELEKENKELKTVKIPQLERRIASIRGCHSVDAKKLNARIKQVGQLKKEISELKKEIKDNEDLATVAYMQGADSQKKKSEKQLIKAKEIIKKFSEFVNNKAEYDSEHSQEYTDLWYELCAEAEQFLKEVSE